MQNEETKTEETTLLDPTVKVIGIEDIRIPDCCREGWPNCPHVLKKQKKIKRNIAL